jgi:hypothetical protein
VRKNFKLGLAAAAIAACATFAAPQALAGIQKYESHIGISDRAPAFHGDVDAEVPQCVPARIVRLYREKTGEDKLLGQDQTDGTGEWAITEPDDFTLKSGLYYAKVTATIVGADRCKRDRSRKIFVD